MLGRETQSYEAALRSLQFVARERLSDASPELAALTREFEDVVNRCQRAFVHQEYGTRMSRAGTLELRVAERRLRERHLRPLARIAQAANREEDGMAQTFRMPRRRLPVTLLLADAAAMRQLAERHAELFQRYGRSPEFLAEFDAAMGAVTGCVTRRNRARQLHVAATKAIAMHLSRARQLIAVLDTVIAARFEDDAARRAEWQQAKRVQLKSGPKRGHGTPAAADAPVAPDAPVEAVADSRPALGLIAA